MGLLVLRLLLPMIKVYVAFHDIVYFKLISFSMSCVCVGLRLTEETAYIYFTGYDVFLGNLRGLVSREHVDKNISSRK